MHLEAIGHPIANDVAYGGKYRNNGIDELFSLDDFEGLFQNEKLEGKDNLFLILWLHAYKYTYKNITARTKMPVWTE